MISFFCFCLDCTSIVTYSVAFNTNHGKKKNRSFSSPSSPVPTRPSALSSLSTAPTFDTSGSESESESYSDSDSSLAVEDFTHFGYASPVANHLARPIPAIPMFFRGGVFGSGRRERTKQPLSTLEASGTYAKVRDTQSALAAVSIIDKSKRNEFLDVERSADPYDRSMAEDDARSYYTNPKNREYYRRIKTLQGVQRATTIQMGGDALLQQSEGKIANVGNGLLVVRESVKVGDVTLRKGDHLECISDHQVFNKTSMREHKLLDALSEAYSFNAARDAYRRPSGYTTPVQLEPTIGSDGTPAFYASSSSAPASIREASSPYRGVKQE